MGKNKYFSIDDIQEVATEDSVEFAISKIAVLSTKPNSHKINITKEILKRDGYSVLGKWVIAEYNGTDVTTHTPNTHIIGYVPKDSNIEFVDNADGTTTMFVEAIISKLYATDVYKLFREHNFRNVSVEMATSNDTEREDGTIDIDGLKIYSICVLGLTVNGSCPDANMVITRFCEENSAELDEYYHTRQEVNLKHLAEKRNENLKVTSHPIDKSKGAVDMGSWDGDKAKDDLLKEKNFKGLAKSVCLLLEKGWENREKGALKYPVMNLKNGKWVYNAQGLSSARAYGEQHDPSVADKAISIQKKLGLYKENKEMSNENTNKEESMDRTDEKNFSNSEDKEKDVVMDETQEMSKEEMSAEKSTDEKPEDKKEDEKTEDKEMCGDKSMSEDSDDKEKEEDSDKEEDKEKEMSCGDEKKFSLDAYIDQSAMLAMLEKETDEYKEMVNKLTKEFSANDIVAEFVRMSKENAELKAEKEKIDAEKQSKKLAAIMASVKEDLDEKTFAELSEEGKVLSFEQLGAFENKVKAFAYEATKKNKEQNNNGTEDIMKFGSNDDSNEYDNDVFNRIAKM